MPLKRPVTVAQARRWPAAAKRRQSFCARMGGMRELLTGERAARDPASPINRALAAWDCDDPELLKRQHVSKGIRMKVTASKVGSEAKRAPARKNPARKTAGPARKNPKGATLYIVHRADAQGKPAYDIAMFRKRSEALEYARAYAKRYDVPVVLTSRDL